MVKQMTQLQPIVKITLSMRSSTCVFVFWLRVLKNATENHGIQRQIGKRMEKIDRKIQETYRQRLIGTERDRGRQRKVNLETNMKS